MALEYRYVSTYKTSKGVSTFISFIGWIVVIISILMLIVFGAVSQDPSMNLIFQSFGFMGFISACGGLIGGLLLIAAGQSSRASLDSADFNGEMLAITKASLDARNTAGGQRIDGASSTVPSRPLPSQPITPPANGTTVREEETIRVAPRTIEIPPGVENQKLSVREAAQIISVANSTMQDYINSGRISTNPDGTIDLYTIYQAGFIVRKLPPNRRA